MKGQAGIVIAVVAFGALALALWGVRGAAAEAVYPVENGKNWFSRHVVARVRAACARMDLAEENRRLKAENDALRMELAVRAPQKADRAPLQGHHWIPAPVLSRNGTMGVRGYLRVGKGALAGVRKDAAVAVPEGLVGRVSAVSPHTCDVRLISDPSVRVACEIETADPSLGPVYGILYGGGSMCIAAEAEATLLYVVNPLRIRHLRQVPDLPPRAKIITSGLGGIFPRGLVVGFLVEGQRVDNTKLEREGDVVPAVDFPSLENVFIRRED